MEGEKDGHRNRKIFDKLVATHQTAHKTPFDKPVILNATERDDIANCRLDGTRPYLFSFKGRPRFGEFKECFGGLRGTEGMRMPTSDRITTRPDRRNQTFRTRPIGAEQQ